MHEFFAVMEDSKSTTLETGWQPYHLLVTLKNDDQSNKENQIAAIVPLFLKTHSYGEYVFDWAWADAYQRHAMQYYPKLLNAIPFTPATGQRWAIDQTIISTPEMEKALCDFIHQTIANKANEIDASSCHSLFIRDHEKNYFSTCGWMQRVGYQYHWFNNQYKDFDDFLSTMSSRKRKNILKERKKVHSQNIVLTVKEGEQINDKDWKNFYLFYQTTYIKRSGHTGYLSADFFPLLAKKMAPHLVMIQAHTQTEKGLDNVAAALFFKDSQTLYGRYWGCKENYDSLHFEACYYQGIEYAIRNNIQRFDPGAQGEHKIQRGFKPIKTYSSHWIKHPEFSHAIQRFLVEETKEIENYIKEAQQLLPFKQT